MGDGVVGTNISIYVLGLPRIENVPVGDGEERNLAFGSKIFLALYLILTAFKWLPPLDPLRRVFALCLVRMRRLKNSMKQLEAKVDDTRRSSYPAVPSSFNKNNLDVPSYLNKLAKQEEINGSG